MDQRNNDDKRDRTTISEQGGHDDEEEGDVSVAVLAAAASAAGKLLASASAERTYEEDGEAEGVESAEEPTSITLPCKNCKAEVCAVANVPSDHKEAPIVRRKL